VLSEIIWWIGSISMAIVAIFLFLFVPVENNISEPFKPRQIYYVDNISAAHQELIAGFNRKFKGKYELIGIDLPFSKFSTNERKEILTRSLRGHSSQIDVFAIDLIWGSKFVKYAEPLGSRFLKSELDQLNPESLVSCFDNSQLVAIPLYLDIGFLYYRKDLLNYSPSAENLVDKLSSGLTWPEFLQLLSAHKINQAPVFLFAAKNFEGMLCLFYELVGENELKRMFAQPQVRLTSPQAEEALDLMKAMIYKDRYTPVSVTRRDEYKIYRQSLSENAVFFRGWPGLLTQHQHLFNDSVRTTLIGAAPLPHVPGEKRAGVYGGWNLMISRFSKNKEGAVEFLRYAMERENQKMMYLRGGYLPANKKVLEDKDFMATQPELSNYQVIMANGIHRPYREDYTRISDVLSFYLHQALINEMSAGQALHKAEQDINTNQPVIR
jgi:ABC-type glycerol-3-phosphate transport system substrate-binding protein